MKKNQYIVLIFCVFFISNLKAQTFSQWGNLEKGSFGVGYKDTVLFKENEQFNFFDYHYFKPFFISIWYPATDNKKLPYMNYKDYFKFSRKIVYANLYDTLMEDFRNVIITDGVCKNIKNEGQNNDEEYDQSKKKLFEEILSTRVNAKKNLVLAGQKLPCIFYHHGAQSLPFDNNVFCEYMASRGFIVVSSNYNLPIEKNPQYLNCSLSNDCLDDMNFVLDFVLRMPEVDTSRITAIGHSWGAQSLILFDNSGYQKHFKKIISLHTTIEDKSLEEAKSSYPSFEYIYRNECKKSTTPVFLFAAPNGIITNYSIDTAGNEKVTKQTLNVTFNAFRQNKVTPYTFITLKHFLNHDGYITLGNLRMPYCKKYNLPDKISINSQQKYYEKIIKSIEKIISKSFNNEGIKSIFSTDGNFNVEFCNRISSF